jgi:hypothetical protein
VGFDDPERDAALRRALLLLAAGGNPRRELDLYGRAVTSVAADLDSQAARSQLYAGLLALAPETSGLVGATAAREELLADPDLAWQCLAQALLAEALGD